MPQTSSENRSAGITTELVTVLQCSHPPTPFLDTGTPKNDVISQLQEIYQSRHEKC